MAINRYDAIVVGARCAGSPTAMLLARKGYKVLVVDRARFPSDTVSTQLLHPPGWPPWPGGGCWSRSWPRDTRRSADPAGPAHVRAHHPARHPPAPTTGAGAVLAAIHGNQEAMDGFARVIAGVTSPTEFFSEENVRRITLRAGAAAPA
jgi:choline dehydrogenase-like flavoprotein